MDDNTIEWFLVSQVSHSSIQGIIKYILELTAEIIPVKFPFGLLQQSKYALILGVLSGHTYSDITLTLREIHSKNFFDQLIELVGSLTHITQYYLLYSINHIGKCIIYWFITCLPKIDHILI